MFYEPLLLSKKTGTVNLWENCVGKTCAIFVLFVANDVMTTSDTMFSAVSGDLRSLFLEDIMRHILSHRLLNDDDDPNAYTLTNT